MLIEKDFYEMILNNSSFQSIFSNRIYFLELEENDDKTFPYFVVQPILPGSTREVEFFKPLIQLDIYHSNKYIALEIAEAVIAILKNVNGIFGTITISNFISERRTPLRLEKDLWKVPIDTTFNCKSNFY